MVLVETAGLTKVFGDVRAVDDLTVKIPDGAIGLVGPNGAGKTTFLRLLLGLLQPTAGTAKVLGRDIGDGVPVRERIGYMPEHDCLIPDMTGVGLVAYMGRISGLDRDTAMSRSHDGHQIAAGELSQLLTGSTDRLRIDVRGDQAAFARLLKEAGFEADAGATGLHVARKPGLESAVFETAKVLGAEVRYMGKEIRSLEELFLELVARTEKRGA